MKHLKRFESLFNDEQDRIEHEMLTKATHLLNSFGIKWSIGNDHVGNEGVILFNIEDCDFEIYYIDEHCFNVCYKKDDKWDSFKTFNLKASLEVIIQSGTFLAPKL